MVHQEGHNPQAILYKGKWIIFHIGSVRATSWPHFAQLFPCLSLSLTLCTL